MSDNSTFDTRPLTEKEWFITLLVLAIPLVNIVMYVYWAVADGVNLNKRNFCRASIAWIFVGILIGSN
jgi:hypothetical protein